MRYKYSFFLLLLINISVVICMTVLYRDRLWQYLLEKRGYATIVFYGDSITAQGQWNSLLGQWNIRNAGIPGLGIGHLKEMLNTQVIRFQPSQCWIMAGINDLTLMERNVLPTFNDYVAVLDELRAAGITPKVQLTLFEWNNPASKAKVDSLNNLLEVYCKQEGIKIINPNEWLSDSLGLKQEYARDKTHLNEAGYQQWAIHLKAQLD